jgi:hypothetical protein
MVTFSAYYLSCIAGTSLSFAGSCADLSGEFSVGIFIQQVVVDPVILNREIEVKLNRNIIY